MRIRLIITAEVSGEAMATWATQQLEGFVRGQALFIFGAKQVENIGSLQVKWEPAPTCVRCGRELVVPQLLDHIDRPEGTVCMPCMGGS